MDERFIRQIDIVNPEEITKEVHVFGLGTIGSFTAVALGKMGFKAIHLYDFDTVEEHNIPCQFYKKNAVGIKKVQAMSDLISEQVYDYSVYPTDMELKADTILNIPEGSIVISAFDNMESRKILWDKLKGRDYWLIDGRMGLEMFRIFTVKCNDSVGIEKYEDSLEGATVDLPCTGRGIIYNSLGIASFITSIVKKIIKREGTYFEVAFSFKNYQSEVEV